MFKLFVVAAVVAVAAAQNPQDAQAQVLVSDSAVNPDGSYNYRYETSNGIQAQESGVGGQTAQGSYSYTGDDGVQYQVTYVADQNGFQPQGAHLPVEGPAPEHVLKTLQLIRANPPRDDPNFSLDALDAAIARLSGKK
ncbi:cuticle protein CP14.6-like [Anopheles bellator]|uniref:cuticle protein CP14.6-like n=1 Tax=Anopheles bellator TaxID=139047 RepID=UPI0026475C00|nr:cuticle protein CP14.6-like [Anopheles bellator]